MYVDNRHMADKEESKNEMINCSFCSSDDVIVPDEAVVASLEAWLVSSFSCLAWSRSPVSPKHGMLLKSSNGTLTLDKMLPLT